MGFRSIGGSKVKGFRSRLFWSRDQFRLDQNCRPQLGDRRIWIALFIPGYSNREA